MIRHSFVHRVSALGLAIGLALSADAAHAQHAHHSTMETSSPAAAPAMKKTPTEKGKEKPSSVPEKKTASDTPATIATPPTTATSVVDPAVMDHGNMGHGELNVPSSPSLAQPIEMDHSAMGHGELNVPSSPSLAQPIDHSAMGHTMPKIAPREPLEPIPVLTDADRAATFPKTIDHAAHGDGIHNFFLLDRLEAWNADPGTGLAWEGLGWIGTDLNKLWLRSEGERIGGVTEANSLEVLYGRSVGRWWDMVGGIRQDFEPGASQSWAAIGVQGLAPQKFEVAATAYLGTSGQTAFRLEAERELLLTNRLILQPLVEINFFGKDDPERGIGSGLSTIEAGLRLRYEVTRQFAPYIGVVRERAFGGTADFHRDANEAIDDTRFVMGVRVWF